MGWAVRWGEARWGQAVTADRSLPPPVSPPFPTHPRAAASRRTPKRRSAALQSGCAAWGLLIGRDLTGYGADHGAARTAVAHADLCGAQQPARGQPVVPDEPRQGANRIERGLRSADP